MQESLINPFSEELLNSSIKDIVCKDYEFAIIIDVVSGICKIINRHGKEEIPNLLDNDLATYKNELTSFLNNSIMPENRDEAYSKMNLSTVIKKTENGNIHSVIFPVCYSSNTIKYKKWRYYRLQVDNRFIIFTRADVTDSTLSEFDTITSCPTKEKTIVEIKKILAKTQDHTYYLMWLDIDEFQDYKELFGKNKTNELLKFLANELRFLPIPNIKIGHIEQDEFLCFLDADFFNKEPFEKSI